MNEVELLLLVVIVAAGLVAGRNLDRIHSEGRHAERAADLAKSRTLGQRVDVCDGIALALHDIVSLFSHSGRVLQATRSAERSPPRAQSTLTAASSSATPKAGSTSTGSPSRKPRTDSRTSVIGLNDAAAWTHPVSRS